MKIFRQKLNKPGPISLTAFMVFIALVPVFIATAPGNAKPNEKHEQLLTIDSMILNASSGYTVTREFVGRVEARRESRVGFELDGLVSSVLVEEGDFVEKGKVIAVLDTELLRARRAEFSANRKQAWASMKLAEGTRQRVREANELNAVSSQEWDEAERNYSALKAALDQARSAVNRIDVRISKSQLKAPFSALVAERFVDEGQVISAGTPVLGLLESSKPEARIGVAGEAIDTIRTGDIYSVEVRGKSIAATVRAILPVRKTNTRSVDIILTLNTEFDGIRSGDLARLQWDKRVNQAGFWIPLSALTESSRGLWAVYVINLNEGGVGVLERRELEMIYQKTDRAFVRGDLSDGMSIVRSGLHRLVPRQRVRVAAIDEQNKTLTSAGGRS